MQACVGGLRVLTRRLSQCGHQILPPLNIILQPPSLLCLRPNESPEVPSPRHYLQYVPLKEGLR